MLRVCGMRWRPPKKVHPGISREFFPEFELPICKVSAFEPGTRPRTAPYLCYAAKVGPKRALQRHHVIALRATTGSLHCADVSGPVKNSPAAQTVCPALSRNLHSVPVALHGKSQANPNPKTRQGRQTALQ